MFFRTLPQTDLQVAPLCLGGDTLTKLPNEATCFAALDAYAAAGGNFIDTAHIYGNKEPDFVNENERLIGKWLKQNNCRNQMVLATKGGHPPLGQMEKGRLDKASLSADLDESLLGLGTDRVELYYLHRDDRSRCVDEICETLAGFVQAGKVRYLGASNWWPDRVAAFNAYAKAHNLPPFVVISPKWSLAQVNLNALPDKTLYCMDAAGRALVQTQNMGVICYSPQAKGYFAKGEAGITNRGKYHPIYELPENNARLARVLQLAKEKQTNANCICLAWLMAQSTVTIPIIGFSGIEQLTDSLCATQIQLTPAQAHWLETGDSHAT